MDVCGITRPLSCCRNDFHFLSEVQPCFHLQKEVEGLLPHSLVVCLENIGNSDIFECGYDRD